MDIELKPYVVCVLIINWDVFLTVLATKLFFDKFIFTLYL